MVQRKEKSNAGMHIHDGAGKMSSKVNSLHAQAFRFFNADAKAAGNETFHVTVPVRQEEHNHSAGVDGSRVDGSFVGGVRSLMLYCKWGFRS